MADNTVNDVSTTVKRVPPHDNEAEQALLACMLFDSEGTRVGIENVTQKDFYSPANGFIFEAIGELFETGKAIDFITVKNKLVEMDFLDKVGGQDYILKLATLVATSANAKDYADIIKQNAQYRNLIKVAESISTSAYQSNDSVDNILADAERGIFDVAQQQNSSDFSPMHEVVAEAIDKIDMANQSDNHVTGLETGFIDFDRKTAGLQPSDLIIIAARPSMGKTAFALNIAQHIGVKKKVPVAIFSLEMSKVQLVTRMLAVESRVEAGKLRSGGLTPDDFKSLAYAMGVLAEAPIYIDDTSNISPGEIRAKCAKLRLEKGLGLIVIDYLQLMNAGSKRRIESVQQEVAYISKSLKAIAREFNVPVIALSQLSRAVEKRDNKRPMLSDLRESGSIEQDADMVCFLYREAYHNKETENQNTAEVIIGKQRNGALGTVNLVWQGQYTRFDNMVEVDEFDIPPDMREE
jgi:replicative DNA helicase